MIHGFERHDAHRRSLALVLLIISFFAKIPGGVKWAGLTLFFVVVLQWRFASSATSRPTSASSTA